MNLLTKCWNFSTYGFRRKNIWMWVFTFSHSNQWGKLKTYKLLAFAAPPVGENEKSFGGALIKPASTRDSNSGLIGHSIRDLCRFSKNGPHRLNSEADCSRMVRTLEIPLVAFWSEWSRDLVCLFLWDLDEIWTNKSEKSYLEKIQNGGKSVEMQMGVAYMWICVLSQGLQGKRLFCFRSYGWGNTEWKVKRAVIAPPWGRPM